MRKLTITFLLVFLIVSCKTIYINAWKDTMICCEPYTIKKIEFGTDDIYPGISEDSISVMHITIAQTNSNYKIEGPDYCLLSVINEKNDTIGRMAINGMPSPGKPRTYPAYGSTVWKTKPDLTKMRIYLPPYCDDLKIK